MECTSLNLRCLEDIFEFFNNGRRAATFPDKIFSYIEDLSRDPERELFTRAIWQYQKWPHMKANFYLTHEVQVKTRCGYTTDALKVALGIIFLDPKRQKQDFDLESFVPIVKENAAQLSDCKDLVFAYSFSLFPTTIRNLQGEKTGWFGGHDFCVIQYLDEKNEVRYRFFQSNITAFSLYEYLEKGALDLSNQEFHHFMQRLTVYTSLRYWTSEHEDFYAKYFNLKSATFAGGIADKGFLEVTWKECSFAKLVDRGQDFNELRESLVFPKWDIIPDGVTTDRLQALETVINTKLSDEKDPDAVNIFYIGRRQNVKNTVKWSLLSAAITAAKQSVL